MPIEPFSPPFSQAAVADLQDRLARTRWIDEISGSGWQYGLNLAFLRDLCDYWQQKFDWKAQVDKLAAAVRALDQAAWEQEFGAPPEAVPGRGPDLNMLALTAVSTVLVPYFKTKGESGRPAAASLAARVEQALTADSTGGVLWVPFKENPEALEAAIVPILKDKLGKDAGLIADLEKLSTEAVKEQTPRPGQIGVEQRIRLIQGTVVGAAIGTELVNSIYANVKQVVGTVGPGGRLTGVKFGNI